MQSKTAFILLGLLSEKSLNPYEIIKILDHLNIGMWSSVSPSSVYTTIRTLEKKGWISSKKEPGKVLPQKSVYSIENEGKKEFLQAMEYYLSQNILEPVHFNLASLFMCHLEKNRVLELLESRLKVICLEAQLLVKAEEAYKDEKERPEYTLISLKHNAKLYEAEKELTRELIKQINKTKKWDYYLTH